MSTAPGDHDPPPAVSIVFDEVLSGDAVSLSAAGQLFPAHRGAGRTSPSTMFRRVAKGAKAADGRVVKLEAVRVGGQWLTSRAALARFVAQLSVIPDSSTAPPARPVARPQAARSKASERATRELEKRGA